MKLPPLTTPVFLFSPATAVNSSRRHGNALSRITKTLSATTKLWSPTTKKPAPLAGYHYPTLCRSRRPAAAPALHSIIQTPTSY